MSEHLIAVDLPSSEGRLGAVLHLPDGARRASVLLVPDGAGDRIGPGRLYVRLARRLCASGYAVLRFDAEGIGDSEGRAASWSRARLDAASGQAERHTACIAATQYLANTTGADDVALVSFGSGIFAAADLARAAPEAIAGVFAVGPPIAVRGGAAQGSPSWLRAALRRRLRHAGDPAAWRRLFRGESDCAAMLTEVGGLFGYPKRPPAIEPRLWSDIAALSALGKPPMMAWATTDASAFAYADFVAPRAETQLRTHLVAGDAAFSSPSAFAALADQVLVFCAGCARRAEADGARQIS